MYDAQGNLLYVGQSQNLRKRVSSYRYIHPDRHSARLVALVNSVCKIEWEESNDPGQARLLESRWLREKRPAFNRMDTYQRLPPFWGVDLQGQTLVLLNQRHALDPTLKQQRNKPPDFFVDIALPEETVQWFGAFRGPAAEAFQALGRICWRMVHGDGDWSGLPRPFLQPRLPSRLEVRCPDRDSGEQLRNRVRLFLEGTRNVFADFVLSHALPETLFDRGLWENDHLLLDDFFRRGPVATEQWRRRYRPDQAWVSPEELHDWRVG